jgi:hypothetical protein
LKNRRESVIAGGASPHRQWFPLPLHAQVPAGVTQNAISTALQTIFSSIEK